MAVVLILYVPAVVTVAVMVCETFETATPAVIVPEDAVLQEYAETMAVPLEVGLNVVLEKLQFGVVFKVNELLPTPVGVPVAISSIV